MLLVIGWIVGAARLAAGDIERSRTEGTARFGQLAEARILAQQARTDETLQLITRGDITASEKSFYGHIDDLVARIGTASPAASAAVDEVGRQPPHAGGGLPRRRLPGRGRPGDRHRSGRVGRAVRRRRIEPARRDRADPRHACATTCPTPGATSRGRPTGTLVLMALAAAAAVVGLWPRLKEFL